jgi:uncharacterized protein YndB with AHSA1/START domain
LVVRAAHSVDLAQSPRQVFGYVCQLERYPEWARRVVEVRVHTPGDVATGTSFTIVNRVPGRTMDVEYQVTALEPDRLLVFAGGPASARAEFRFEMAPRGSGCRFTERVDMQFSGVWRLAGPLIGWLSQRQLATNHAWLRRTLDGQPRPSPEGT